MHGPYQHLQSIAAALPMGPCRSPLIVGAAKAQATMVSSDKGQEVAGTGAEHARCCCGLLLLAVNRFAHWSCSRLLRPGVTCAWICG